MRFSAPPTIRTPALDAPRSALRLPAEHIHRDVAVPFGALALRVNCVRPRATGDHVAAHGDAHVLAEVLAALQGLGGPVSVFVVYVDRGFRAARALREDAVRFRALGEDAAGPVDRDAIAGTVAAGTPGDTPAVLVAGDPAAAARALREDASRTFAAGVDDAFARHLHLAAVAAVARVVDDAHADADVEAVGEAAVDSLPPTPAAADALCENAIARAAVGVDVAVRGDIDYAAVTGGSARTANADRAGKADCAHAAGAAAATNTLRKMPCDPCWYAVMLPR
ncbi:MAG: hypothetical protein IPN64_13770 [Propionivibrio sp.]|uniref:hypothetical protein n=1 Tax=Propionivibrio sp. TaxID=2212460 RepID=UPI0025E78868|nr:hypothetical protein [Propionivibrio sp.]MBK8895052.1 hypothetical protein [Propionivibrio sp.]